MSQCKITTSGGNQFLPALSSPPLPTSGQNQGDNKLERSYAQSKSRTTSTTSGKQRPNSEHQQSRSSVQTQTSPTSASAKPAGQAQLPSGADLPPVVFIPNSALVHQRASAIVSDHLAAASARTGASLPLMIGNRSKCVVNLLDEQQQHQQQQPQPQQQQQQPPQATVPQLGPQNTALRAEQRHQNMSVSVVRPVVVVSSSPADELGGKHNGKSLLDDWMAFDKAYLSGQPLGRAPAGSSLDELLALQRAGGGQERLDSQLQMPYMKSEQELRQQLLLLRREEHELNRGVRRQHEFMLKKLEQRRRHLSIIQSVWAQRDFKHAIEKLVDIYQQGLIFTTGSTIEDAKTTGRAQAGASQLRSLNTSLAVDVLGIIILRPRLWTLDICQLLLPIINQDLLLPWSQKSPVAPAYSQAQYEYYTETGLKALRLVLTNFSSIIKSTLESLKDSGKLVGIDLSREDRINKCLACYKLLLEARSNLVKVATSCDNNDGMRQGKLVGQYRELQTMFTSLFSSIQLEPNILARRLQGVGNGGGR